MSAKHWSPRPTPKFFPEAQTFSTKKARGTPREAPPPKPPVKSCPPVSRIFQHRPSQRAQVVSFKGSDHSGILSPHYNEDSKDLYFAQCFDIVSKLGAGSFGEVYKVKSKEDGKLYAVKRSRDRFKGESDRRRKLEEVAKHEELPKQNNCVTFHKAWEERQHLYIQTELCQTSLNNFAESVHDIPETLIWNYLVDLLMAVNHLHTHDLIHMDIKPENIFISEDQVCKLGDFGLVLDLNKDMSDAQEGDPKYLAPELLDGIFGKSADIFSLGITILELASDLDLPRGGNGWHQLREGHLPDEFLRGRSSELSRVIKWMMDPDPEQRPSAKEVLLDKYVKQVWNRRWRHQGYRSIKDKVQYLLRPLWYILLCMWLYLVTVYKWAARSGRRSTTCSPKNINSEWEHSFSDDEVFAEDINIHDNSMGSPLDCSTSSDKSDHLEHTKDHVFAIPTSLPPRRSHTTPGGPRHRTQIVTPRRSPAVNLCHAFSDRYTPQSSPSVASSVRSRKSSRLVMNSSFNEDCEHDIAPKNLMDAFELGSSDDED